MSWSDLVDATVIGSSRLPSRPADAPPADAPQAVAPSADPPSADPPAALLSRAAAMSRARRAGYRPPLATEHRAPASAPPDHRPEVGQAAWRRLDQLLSAGDHGLAAEWLRLLAGRGGPVLLRRPPDVLLPALLTTATSHAEVRDALWPVLGPLAGWLATFNPDWAWASSALSTRPLPDAEQPPDADGAEGGWLELVRREWETGGIAARRGLLDRLRATDPALGRELVASTWATDPYRDRAAFLAALHTGLGPGDEPLAEQGLADRRADVRRAAAALLVRLPQSRYSQRAATRAAAAVQVETGVLPRRRLVLTLPDEPTAELVADGLDGTPADGSGVKAWLLRQIVAAAPAGFWAGHTGLEPAELLSLAAKTNWTAPLRAGWAESAIRDAHQSWLVALLDERAVKERAVKERAGQGRPEADRDLRLLAAMAAGDREGWLRAHPTSPLLARAAEQAEPPWSVELSDLVRSALAAAVEADPGYPTRSLIRLAAARLEPPEPPQEVSVHEQLLSAWDDFLQKLSVRAAIRRELTEEPKL